MSLLIDVLAEKQIQKAIESGQLDNLQGKGKALTLDDDSMVPAELRNGYRILKNAGYIPAELEQRKHALALCDLLASNSANSKEQEPEQTLLKKLKHIEFEMRVKGIDTRFIHRYLRQLIVDSNE